jgi:hypothetical protein
MTLRSSQGGRGCELTPLPVRKHNVYIRRVSQGEACLYVGGGSARRAAHRLPLCRVGQVARPAGTCNISQATHSQYHTCDSSAEYSVL